MNSRVQKMIAEALASDGVEEVFKLGEGEEKLLNLAKQVKQLIDDKAKCTDWNKREDIKAELKANLIVLLAKNGYPPVDRDEVDKEVFEQAENFKKYQKK